MASVAKRVWDYKGTERSAWVVRYKEGDKHRSRQFERKKDADSFKRKMERETEDGVHVAKSEGESIADLSESFLRMQELRWQDGRISRGAYKNLRQAIDKSIVPHLGKRLAHEITGPDIDAFYVGLRKEGGLAPVTAKERLVKLGQLMDHARSRGAIRVNLVPEALKRLRGVVSPPVRTFTPAEVEKLLRAAEMRRKGQHPGTMRLARCFVHIAAFCGLRYGEIAGLTVDRINFAAGVIEVRHSLDSWDNLKEPKTRAGLRDVPMPSHVAALLREWLASDYVPNDRRLAFRVRLSRSDKGAGGFIHPGSFHTAYWRPLLESAGLEAEGDERLHFHALRHFAASWMIRNLMPLTDVASLLGHKRFDMTLQVYAHPIVGGNQRAAMFQSMADRLLNSPQIEGVAHEIAQDAAE
ncbi:tyrosine-type recombinase/integrase [Terrihabitans sp. B22-R8]|uniref:tyrosine-type recombinase/integrase n=1 Tax=Terrihabitans sp. B22-R8 TaxID=3425128 RepID=UPI00403C5063